MRPSPGEVEAETSDRPVLSVVLPNFNHQTLIPRALGALLSQDRPPDEIVIVDDASTDDSLRVIRQWASRTPTIRVLENSENLGVIASLQRGFAAARGTYVYFAACDDWVMPGFFSLALRMLGAHPDSAFFCADAALVDGESGRPLGFRPIARPRFRAGKISSGQARRLLARIDNWILTGSAVFRRDATLAAGGFDERFGSFADSYMARKLALTHGFCYAPVPVATWCVFPNSVSRTTALRKAANVLDTLPPLIAADPVFPAWYADLFRNRWHFATSRLALETLPVDQELLGSMGARSRVGRAALRMVATALPRPLGRTAALALLWARWRPTALTRVAATSLSRALPRWRASPADVRRAPPRGSPAPRVEQGRRLGILADDPRPRAHT